MTGIQSSQAGWWSKLPSHVGINIGVSFVCYKNVLFFSHIPVDLALAWNDGACRHLNRSLYGLCSELYRPRITTNCPQLLTYPNQAFSRERLCGGNAQHYQQSNSPDHRDWNTNWYVNTPMVFTTSLRAISGISDHLSHTILCNAQYTGACCVAEYSSQDIFYICLGYLQQSHSYHWWKRRRR